jgi:alpha-tubulin suppressor-like RCC1 family protein/uncharacterized protein YjdB
MPKLPGSVVTAYCFAVLTACSGNEPTTPEPPAVANVRLSAPVSTIKATHTTTVQAEALDAAGNVLANRTFSWASDNASVATVDANGIVTGLSQGTANISAVTGGKIGIFPLIVTRAPLAAITVNITPGELAIGKSLQVQAIGTDSTGKTATDVLFKWESSDPAIARIDGSGLVTARAPGTARIDISAEGISASGSITVLPIRFSIISAHDNFSCGLSIGGAAYCWGHEVLGSLGSPVEGCTGTSCSTSTPIPVTGGHVFTSLSDGFASHTCAIAAGGAYCWGRGSAGQIGSGVQAVTPNPVPVKVQSSSVYTSLSVGGDVTCGVTTMQTIDCWGSNARAQLGDPTVTERCPTHTSGGVPVLCSTSPRPVPSSVKFEKVSVGFFHVCALSQGGVAYCWGADLNGEQGSVVTSQCGNFRCNMTPTPVVTELRFSDISVGSGFTCAISTGGRAYCWGGNTGGQLGIGSSSFVREPSPVPVNSTLTFVRIFSGDVNSACALDSAGNAFCWGRNDAGQLGDGSTTSRASPVRLGPDGMRFTSLARPTFHSCGTATDGYAYCWGDNASGRLGIGRDGLALTPTRVAFQ